MNLLNERSRLLTRSPLWAVTPEGFAMLLTEITKQTFFGGREFHLLKPMSLGKSNTHKVSVIPVQGVLTKDCDWCGTTYGSISNAVEEAASDPQVKRIVLAVDSPGGEITGLPETADVLRQAAKVKPVSAVVEGYSASAAYWLTSQAHDITMSPSAEVGSVGVRVMHTDISKALEDAGIKITEMHSGKFKTEWTPFSPLSEETKAHMQKRLDGIYQDFISAVRAGRGARATAGITADRYGEGRMFTAREALGHGLADAVQSPREFYRSITPVSGENKVPISTVRARLDFERNTRI